MVLLVSMILLTGGVCLSACWDTTPLLGADNPPRADTPRSRHPPGSRHPPSRHPPGSRLRDTVNERPVRILLECILVLLKLKFLLLRVDERCSEKSFYCIFTVLREELISNKYYCSSLLKNRLKLP